ncbi:MAG TPA: leucine-rich repeat protein [Bacteroidales bacterium]|nr:leucine-rich repeat protein [Bacteroidales bacterium]
MNKKLLLLFSVLSLTISAWANDFTVDGVAYTIINGTNKTVAIGTGNSNVSAITTSTSGAFTIPSSVTNSGTTYAVTSIGDGAFYGCAGLTTVTIPKSVTSIGLDAFCYCIGLTSVTISSSVTSIGGAAFYNCTGLTSITIPSSVTSIGDGAFYGCIGLTSVTIPKSVTSVGDEAFLGCTGLTSVTILASVTSIGNFVFLGCAGLTSVTIPEMVTSIGSEAFYGCTGLTSITIPSSVTFIRNNAFDNCSSLVAIHANVDPSKVFLSSAVFFNVPTSTCVLYVPAGTKSAYQAADQWKLFTNIVEATLSVSTSMANVAAVGGSVAAIDITSNTDWTASSDQTWLTVSSASGTGNGTLTFTATANTIASTRTATVTVSAPGVTNTITVTQAATQDNALNFDGTDDYVNCGVYNPATYTIEAWVNPNVVNVDQAIISTLSELTITGCELHIGSGGIPAFTVKNAAGWANTIGTAPISSHTWTHLAATYDGSTVKLYVNGVLSATTIPGTCTPGSAAMHIGKRSAGISGWYYFSGTIDEVRVWNTALSATQIADNMYNSIDNPTSVAGLTRYFTFYQGTAGGSNSGITTLIDASASAQNGTLNNFALTGSTSNWVKGCRVLSLSAATASIGAAENSTTTIDITSNTTWSTFSDQTWLTISPSSGKGNGTLTFTAVANPLLIPRTATITILASGVAIQTITVTQQASTGAATLSLSATTASIGATENSTNTVNVTSNTTWTSTSDQSWLSVTPASGKVNGMLTFTAKANLVTKTRTATITVSATGATSQTITVMQDAANNNALNFEGTNDYVSCGAYNPTTFTIEAWVNPNVVNADQAVVSTLSESTSTGCELHISSGGIPVLTIRNANAWADIKSTVPISASNWTHLATTYDGAIVKLYINGLLSASSNAVSYNQGSASMYIGGRSSGSYNFNGAIDEVRIWNTALTESQINGNMYNDIENPASVAGLTRYFTFNQGTAGGSNSGISTLIDASASAQNGTLNNVVLIGSTSNWVAGYMPKVLSVSDITTAIGATEGSTATIKVASNLAWAAVSNQTWLTVNPATATGNGTLTYTAAANPFILSRTATVTISATGATSQTITITQQAASGTATLGVSATTASIEATANSTATVNVTSNTTWTSTSDQTWLTVSPAPATGNGTLTFTAAVNPLILSRTATVTVSATGATSQSITVTQQAASGIATLGVSTTTANIGAAANSTVSMDVSSNTAWTTSSNQTWLTINPVSGTGNSSLTFTVTANPTVSTRSATVTVSATGVNSQTVTVTQTGVPPTLSLLTPAISLAAGTGSTSIKYTFSVKSNTDWTASSNQTWLTVSPASATGNDLLTVSADPNPNMVTRSATVTVSATGGISQTVTVTQDAAAVTLSFSATTATIERATNSTATVDVTSNTTWSASSNETWLTVSPTSATGNGTLTFTANANPTTDTRMATVTISATGCTSQTITVTQDAALGTGAITLSVAVPADGYYKKDDVLDFTVTFDKPVVVTGNPSLSIILNTGGTVQANYLSGSGSANLVFRYTVATDNIDNDGITIGILAFNGGSIKNTLGTVVNNTLNGIASTTGVKVDAAVPTQVKFTEIPNIYIMGQNLDFIATFSEDVIVDASLGIPYIQFMLGVDNVVRAYYVESTPANQMLFRYTIANNDYSNVVLVNDIIKLNGGTVKDNAGNNAKLYSSPDVFFMSNITVDGVIPTITEAIVPGNGMYVAGNSLTFTINFSKIVNVETTVGTPYLALTFGNKTVNAPYISGTGTTSLVFQYTVANGDLASDGIVMPTTISLNGATIKDISGNNANLTFTPPATSGVKVEAVTPVISGDPTVPTGNYTTGQNIDISIHYSENVFVTGSPYILLTIGNSTVQANYQSGSATNTIVFRYTITTADFDTDGITIGTDIMANSSAIVDVAGNAAQSAFNNALTLPYVFINVTSPAVTTMPITAITGTTAIGNGDITSLGSVNPTQYGVVWSTASNPTVALLTKTSQGTVTATGAFTSNITNLLPLTQYYVKAYVTNNGGTSYGDEVTFTTVDIAPDAPTNVTATAGNAKAIINFSTPVPNGGSAVTQYTVTSSPDGRTATGTASPIIVTGLTNGTSYTFTAVATNAQGNSIASAPSAPVTPFADANVVDAASAENLRLYPNPATAEFIIAGVGKGSALKVFDLKGNSLINIESYNGTSVKISNLPCGTYFVKVRGKVFRFVKK